MGIKYEINYWLSDHSLLAAKKANTEANIPPQAAQEKLRFSKEENVRPW